MRLKCMRNGEIPSGRVRRAGFWPGQAGSVCPRAAPSTGTPRFCIPSPACSQCTSGRSASESYAASSAGLASCLQHGFRTSDATSSAGRRSSPPPGTARRSGFSGQGQSRSRLLASGKMTIGRSIGANTARQQRVLDDPARPCNATLHVLSRLPEPPCPSIPAIADCAWHL